MERILDVKGSGEGQLFLVAWLGYSQEYNSWEPQDCFYSDSQILAAFKATLHEGVAAASAASAAVATIINRTV
jgi:hypothetical protein